MNRKKSRLPLLPLRGLSVFPGVVIHFDVGRQRSKSAVNEAMKSDRLLFLTYQPDMMVEEPKKTDLSKMGTVAEIKQTLVLPDGNMRILVEGICRAEMTRFYDEDECRFVGYKEMEEIACDDKLYEKALMKRVGNLLEDYLEVYDKVTPETVAALEDIDDAGTLADITASDFPLKPSQKQELLEELDITKRLEKLIAMMQEEVQVLEIEKGVAKKLGRAIDRNQREYVIREQMKVLQSELDDMEPLSNDVEKYRAELEKRVLPQEVCEKLNEEIERLSRQPGMSQEYSVIQNYIETMLALPWDKKTEINLDIDKAK